MAKRWNDQPEKTAPVAADELLIIDSEDTILTTKDKRLKLSNINVTGTWTRNTVSGFLFPTTLPDLVGIGGNTPLTDLTIFQNTINSKKGITLSGQGVTGNLTTDGVTLLGGNIGVGNMQLWVGQQSDIGNVSKEFFRYIVGVDVPTIDGVNGDGSLTRNINLGGLGANIGIGHIVGSASQGDIVGQLHVKPDTVSKIAQIIEAVGTQTVDLFQVRNSASAPQVVVDDNFRFGVGTPDPQARVHIINAGAEDSFRIDDQVADTTPFVVDVSGNVGLGLTNPTEKLQMFGGNFKLQPHNPTIEGTKDSLSSTPRRIYTVNNHAYVVSAGGNSLTVLDITTPSNPTTLATLTDATNLNGAHDIFVAGKYAYIACPAGNRLTLIDISTPSAPVFKSQIAITGAFALYVSGVHAYVVDKAGSRLVIIDVHNPATLIQDSVLASGGNFNDPTDIYVSGRYAYITGESTDSLSVIDIDDDENPAHQGTVVDADAMNSPQALYIVGNHAYVVSNMSDSLAIVNVGTPTAPTVLSSLINPTFETNSVLDGARHISVSENHAYITAEDADSFTIVDISTPATPVVVGSVNNATTLNGAHGVFVSGKFAYVTASTNNSMSVIDIHGMDMPNANIGNLEVGSLSVKDNVIIADDLYASSINTGGDALIGGQLAVSEKLSVFGDLAVADDLLVVNSTDKSVQIGGTTVAADFSIVQQTTQAKRGMLLTGNGFFGGSGTTDGVFISNILNSVGNMQLGIGQLSDYLNASKNIFRYTMGVPTPGISGVSGTGDVNTHINMGNPQSFVGIGHAFNVPQSQIQGNLHVRAGTTGTIASVIQAFGTQTVDLFQVRNSANVTQVAIDSSFNLNMLTKSISNAVIVTPTIASFVNAQHNHSSAAGGGELTETALTTGVFNTIQGIGAQSEALNMNSNLINSVTDPVSAQDAATKNYVDTHASSVIWQRAATIITPQNSGDNINDIGTINTNTIPAGTNTFVMNGAANVFSVDQRISSTDKLIFGDDLDTFIHQSFNNILTLATANTTRLTLRSEGVIIGDSTTTTNRTGNFLHLPTTAGTPNGTPSAITNRAPMVYDSTNHELFIHDGTFWEPVDHTYARRIKPIDQIVNNSTTIQNDSNMVVNLRSGKTYSGEVVLFLNSPVTPGLKYDFFTPTNSVSEYSSGAASSTVPASTVTMSTVTVLTTDGNNQKVIIQFRIKTTAAGNLIFRWAQNVATAVDTKVLTGSRMVVYEER